MKNVTLVSFLLVLFFGSAWGAKNKSVPLHPSPSMGKRIDGLSLAVKGPNCWNGALLKAGLIHSIRYVPKGEYWFWMTSPYCRQLSSSERPQAGDLGSLIWKGHGHYHSFVYLTPKWVFSKNSPEKKYPYMVQSFSDMFSESGQKEIIKCWPRGLDQPKSQCEIDLIYHRCRPLEGDFFAVDPKLSLWDSRLKKAEEVTYNHVTGDRRSTLNDYEKELWKLREILVEIKEEGRNAGDKLKKFKLESLEYRTLGLILANVEIYRERPSLYPLVDYAYRLQEMKKKSVPKNYY